MGGEGWKASKICCGKLNVATFLKSISYISPKESEGLRRTISLCARMPTEYRDDIKRTESDYIKERESYSDLEQKYRELFLMLMGWVCQT